MKLKKRKFPRLVLPDIEPTQVHNFNFNYNLQLHSYNILTIIWSDYVSFKDINMNILR